MYEEKIRGFFEGNWVFWMYSRWRWPWFVLVGLIALTPFLVGAGLAELLGVFPLYYSNFLNYTGPIIIVISLSSYYWFYVYFPKDVDVLIPAIDANEADSLHVMEKWANRLANRIWVMLLFSLIPAGLGLADTFFLWSPANQNWVGSQLVGSAQSQFFEFLYAFYYVILIAFLVGSGMVGILGTVLSVNELLSRPIKLDYYRHLRSVTDLSTGVGIWAFVALLIILIGSTVIKPHTTPEEVATSVVFSVLGSAALLGIFLLPLIPAHLAIVQAKKLRLEVYENRLAQISAEIEALLAKKLDSPEGKAKAYLARLELLYKGRSLIAEQVEEIESIPDWPIRERNTVGLIASSVLAPLLGTAPDYLKSLATPLLAKFLPFMLPGPKP